MKCKVIATSFLLASLMACSKEAQKAALMEEANAAEFDNFELGNVETENASDWSADANFVSHDATMGAVGSSPPDNDVETDWSRPSPKSKPKPKQRP